MDDVGKVAENFNIYDLFTVMLPGMIVLCIGYIWVPVEYLGVIMRYGAGKFVLFFLLSYFVGAVLRELGAVLDKNYLYEKLYGGNPKDVYIVHNIDDESKVVLHNIADRQMAAFINKAVLDRVDYTIKKDLNDNNKQHFVCDCCMNYLEARGLSFKANKMGTIFEFSRSIMVGIPLIIILLYLYSNCHAWSIPIESHIIALSALLTVPLFYKARIRYEQFRYSTILRTYYLTTIYDELKGNDLEKDYRCNFHM